MKRTHPITTLLAVAMFPAIVNAQSEPPVYVTVDCMKATSSDYVQLELETWKPVHQHLVDAGKGDTLMESVDFIYCEQTSATAAAFVSYHAADADLDTPTVITAIKAPVLVVAGTEDTAVRDLPEKMEPVAEGDRVQLLVMDGADHFFRDLYSEDIADAVAERLGM